LREDKINYKINKGV